MNIKGNIKYLLAGTIVFLLVYLLLAAIPMGRDFYFEPTWVRYLPENAEEQTPSEQQLREETAEPFVLGTSFGYFTGEGTLLFTGATEERVAISPLGWTTYPHDAEQTTITLAANGARVLITEPGYVHLQQDRIYLFHPGGNRVSRYDANGSPLWTRAHSAPITAFNTSPSGTVLGYADGNLSVLDQDGLLLSSLYPGGSDHEVILGASISPDGSLVACVSGIDRQRFIVASRMGNQYRIVYHSYLDGNLRRQAYVHFEQSGRYAFFETATGLGVFDSTALASRVLPIAGRIVATGSDPSNTVFTVLTRVENRFTLSVLEEPDHLIAKTEFAGEHAFLRQQGTTIYLGIDNRISRIDIRGYE